ncbi:MAG: ABC transporter ATP-binding protein [Patescibacteria group bacterium]|jgi:ABC-2 type transport system ATP-binding protein
MPVLEFHNLAKHFGQTKAIDGITYSVEKGEVFGFLGPNGAGKTTTIRCLMDFIRPSSGSISLFGRDSHQDAVDLKHQVGYLSGYVRMNDKWTGREHIRFYKKLNGRQDSSDELIKRLDFDPTKHAGQLSSGNKQKLGIILAFMHNPDLLVLDEPTTGLDPLLQNDVYELINERVKNGATIFFSSHNLPEVEKICTRVGIIRQGKMVAVQSIDELKVKKVYHVHAHTVGGFDRAKFNQSNVTWLEAPANEISLEVRGDVTEIVKTLSSYQLSDLLIERAPLDKIFLEYYEQ